MSDPFSGGNSTYDSGGYRYRVFTADGTLVKADATAIDVDYLIVAGGGGGGGYFSGGGGGAGGVLADTDELTTAGNYAIVVGDGGTGGVATQNSDQSIGTDGEASSFNGHSATGGGGGGGRISTNVDQPGRAGGSGGGGGGRSSAAGGNGTAGQGNNGGAARSGTTAGTGAGGGGGGKGAVGSAGNSSNVGGNGGAGYQWLDGNYYAGGGGGGAISGSTGGTGGTGGGGDGGAGSGNPGENGTANTGGGGGGGGNTSTTGSAGGDGGSGIVVVRYAIDPILISAAPVDHASIVVTFDTPLPGADSHNLYRSATQGFTPGAGNRILTGLSATPTPVTDTGLDSETTYYYVAGGVIGGVETLSAEVSATTALSPGQYSTFFGEYTADAAPDDWSALFGTTSEFVIKDGETHFDRALRMTIASGNRVARVWDDVGVASGTVQACAVVNRQINDSASNGVILAAGGEAGVEYGYALFLSSATITLTTAIIRRYEAGAATQLGSWTFANYDSSGGAGYPYGLLFEYNPATGALRAKAWRVLDFEDPLANIPATWQEFSDAAPLPLGKVGLWGFNADTYRCGYFSAGTGGLAAQLPAEVGVALRWSVPGAVADTSAAIVVATTTDASVVVEYDTDAAFGSVASSAATASEAPAFAARVALTGLDPDTQYYYRIKLDGGAAHAETGAFKTAPTPGTAKTFSVSTASCSDTDSDHAIFGVLEDEVHDLFIHTGDLHYLNISTDSDELFQSGYHRSIGIPAQNAAYRIKAWDYVWDDHDWGANNSDASSASAPAAQTVYRQLAPHYSIPAGPEAPIYHAFTWGRVRFIVTDLRSERSANSATDNASKTMLGATQKAWFKSELTDARDAGLAIAWVCTSVWPGATANGTDGWRSFNTERTELADFFQDEDLLSRMVIISGDWHALGLDDGTNSNFATTPVGNGPPVLQCAPLDQVPTSVPFTPSEGYRAPESGEGQYALITFTDAGGTSITVTYSGYYVSAGGVKTLWQTADYVVDAVVPPTEPGVPVITGEADSESQITVEFTTPGSQATSHRIDWGTDPDDLTAYGPLGAVPSPEVFADLEPETAYYFRPVAINEYAETAGVIIAVSTPGPSLRVVYVTETTAGVVLEYDPGAVKVRYVVAANADTGFASILHDETETNEEDGNPFAHEITDLVAGTTYRAKAQSATTLGGAFGEWTEPVVFVTLAAPARVRMGGFTAPAQGAVLSGAQTLVWDLRTPAAYEERNDWDAEELAVSENGEDWSVLATDAQMAGPTGTFAINMANYTDSFVTFRIRGERGDGAWGEDYLTLYNNDGDNPVDPAPTIDLPCWVERISDGEGTWYLLSESLGDLGRSIYVRKGDVAVWLPCAQPDPLGEEKEVIKVAAVATGLALSEGGTYYWWLNNQITGAFFGIDIYTADFRKAASARFTYGQVWPVYPCKNPDNLTGGGWISYTSPASDGMAGVPTRLSQGGYQVQGRGGNDECGVRGAFVPLSLVLEKAEDGNWTFDVFAVGHTGKGSGIMTPGGRRSGLQGTCNLPDGLGCGCWVALRAGGVWYDSAFHSGAAVRPGGVGITYGDPCTPPELPSPSAAAPAIDCAVVAECYVATLTVSADDTITAVRWYIAAATDIGFVSPVVDTGWGPPDYIDGALPPAAYYVQQNMAPGSYLAKVVVLIDSIEYECGPVPFTILDLSVDFWGGWDNRTITA
jgi:hypothetical protein